MFRLALFAAVFLLLLLACNPLEGLDSSTTSTSNEAQIRIETEGDPVLGLSPILVYVSKNGESVSGAKIDITGDMTHAGMEPVISTAIESEKGLYRADDFRFTMAGDWILTVEVELEHSKVVRAEKFLTIVR